MTASIAERSIEFFFAHVSTRSCVWRGTSHLSLSAMPCAMRANCALVYLVTTMLLFQNWFPFLIRRVYTSDIQCVAHLSDYGGELCTLRERPLSGRLNNCVNFT